MFNGNNELDDNQEILFFKRNNFLFFSFLFFAFQTQTDMFIFRMSFILINKHATLNDMFVHHTVLNCSMNRYLLRKITTFIQLTHRDTIRTLIFYDSLLLSLSVFLSQCNRFPISRLNR